VVGSCLQPLAQGRDRPLAVGVHERDRLARGLTADGRVHAHPEPFELGDGAPAQVVVAHRGEERARTGQFRELHGRDRAAAAGQLPGLLGMHDLAGVRDVVHAHEPHPLEVADHRDVHRPEGYAQFHLRLIPRESHGVRRRILGGCKRSAA
jgi:hypothetical protein